MAHSLATATLALVLMAAAPAMAQPVPGAPPTIPPPPPPPQSLQLPGAPPKLDTFSDKVVRCVHHGGSYGVPADRIGTYTRECVNSR
jgi:hypothetical protein